MSRGYIIVRSQRSSFFVNGAEHIECDSSYCPTLYRDDKEAARAAEADGIKLIRDMPGVPAGVYVDTPETRRILQNYLACTRNFCYSVSR